MESYSFLLLVSLSSVVFSQRQDLSSCGSWSKFNNTASRYGDLQPHIYNQYTCMLTCMGNPLCDSVDYESRANEAQSNCFLHYTTSPTQIYTDPGGATHWKFSRNEQFCGVDCMYAFAANQNAYNEGGRRLARVGDTWNCRKACIDRPGCVAYDWHESNARGDQCYLHTTKAELKQRKNVYHYSFTRQKCTSVTPIPAIEEPSGSHTRFLVDRKPPLLANEKLWLCVCLIIWFIITMIFVVYTGRTIHVKGKEVRKARKAKKAMEEEKKAKEGTKTKETSKAKEEGKTKEEAKTTEEAKTKETIKAKEETKATEATKTAEEAKVAEAMKATEVAKAMELIKAMEEAKAKEAIKATEEAKAKGPKTVAATEENMVSEVTKAVEAIKAIVEIKATEVNAATEASKAKEKEASKAKEKKGAEEPLLSRTAVTKEKAK